MRTRPESVRRTPDVLRFTSKNEKEVVPAKQGMRIKCRAKYCRNAEEVISNPALNQPDLGSSGRSGLGNIGDLPRAWLEGSVKKVKNRLPRREVIEDWRRIVEMARKRR